MFVYNRTFLIFNSFLKIFLKKVLKDFFDKLLKKAYFLMIFLTIYQLCYIEKIFFIMFLKMLYKY